MLRVCTSILCLGLLLLLQYGKITGYLYCEWQAQVVHASPDCDCLQILNGVFDSDEDNNPGIKQQQTKMAEYEYSEDQSCASGFLAISEINQSFFLSHFVSSIIEPAIRPPAGS